MQAHSFQAFLNDLPYALVGLDADGDILLLNHQAEALTGHWTGEVMGHALGTLFPDATAPPAGKVRVRRKDGSELAAEAVPYRLPIPPGGLHLLMLQHAQTPEQPPATEASLSANTRELHLAEALLRALLATTPDAVVVADREARMLAWNQRFVDMWGLSPDVMASSQGGTAMAAVLDRICDPEGFSTRVDHLYDHLEEPEHGSEIRLRDGRVLERRSRGVQDSRGVFWGRAWYYRDVTARREAEEALRESEARFRAVFERAALGIAVVDTKNHRPRLANPALQRLLGRDGETLRRMAFEEFTHPEDVATDVSLAEDVRTGRRESYRISKRFLTPDGQVVWGRLSVSLMAATDHEPPSFLALVEDIAENTALEAGLALMAEVFRTANAVMVTAADGTIKRVNQAFTRITGYPAEEVVGRTCSLLVPDNADDAFYRDMHACLQSAGSWEGEVLSRHKDGTLHPLWESITAVRDEAGEVVRYVSVLTDLTERKMLEGERKRRGSAIEELGRLLAHQLNQPLAAISGYAGGSLLHMEEGDYTLEGLREALERIQDQAQRASTVVQDLRHYFRGEPPAPSPINLNSLIHSAGRVLPPATDNRPYRLSLDLAPDLPPVMGDPVKVQECLVNLVTNAIEAGPHAPGQELVITVATREVNGEVEVTVCDRGPGVSPGLREQVFQPLFTTKGEGTGLGLPICRSIAEEQGGQLWLEPNDPEPGVTFHLCLPATGD